MKNNTHVHVARTSRNKMGTAWDLYCYLLPQHEALRTCCSAFPITTKWCFDQDGKMLLGTTFTKWACNRSGSLQKQVWFSHAQNMKMTRDEHVLGFKSCDISIYWWLWMLSFLLKVYLPVAPDGVLTYGKSKFAATAKQCQMVSVTFIATEWFFQLKKILVFLNISRRPVAARWSPTAKKIVSGPLVQP